MFPKKGLNPYGQPPPYGVQQPYGKIPGSGGYATSAAAAGGTDGARFGGTAAQGAVGQYGGPYAAVYGTQKDGGNLNSTESNPEVKGNKKGGKEIELEKPVSGEDMPTKAENGGLVEVGEKVVSKEKTAVSQKGDSTKHEVVDKDLLQAFRYFDQNRVGYIKAEDLRRIVDNLGKFLSNRDVKDLVQAALAESNSAKDNHVMYTNLVKMVDL